MTVITMSRKELTRVRVLIDVADGRLSETGLPAARCVASVRRASRSSGQGDVRRLGVQCRSGEVSDCLCPLHIRATVHSFVIARIGSIGRLSLPGCHRGASGQRQDDEYRGEPSMRVHCAEILSIRLGSLFLTLPTRALTGQQIMSSGTGQTGGRIAGIRAPALSCTQPDPGMVGAQSTICGDVTPIDT
jgi:hypothetical protein